MTHSTLSLYGLKWNPFAQDLPEEALISNSQVDYFFWRSEQLVKEGGFAMLSGDSGLGKSVTLRMLHQRLSNLRDVSIAQITRPQSSLWEFYAELGAAFNLELKMSRRWHGYKELRAKWLNHINATLMCPVLLIDEAQELLPKVLSEIRLISSMCFDSKSILTIILCGDRRLPDKFRSPELIPLGNRIKARLILEPYDKEQLVELMEESLRRAGAIELMSSGLKHTLAEHASGNPRLMMNMAHELLMLGARRNVDQLDEKLFFECFCQDKTKRTRKVAAK